MDYRKSGLLFFQTQCIPGRVSFKTSGTPAGSRTLILGSDQAPAEPALSKGKYELSL